MTIAEKSHGNAQSNLEGCGTLAGDNIPGKHPLVTPRPEGAPETALGYPIRAVSPIRPIQPATAGPAVKIHLNFHQPTSAYIRLHQPIWPPPLFFDSVVAVTQSLAAPRGASKPFKGIQSYSKFFQKLLFCGKKKELPPPCLYQLFHICVSSVSICGQNQAANQGNQPE